MTHDPARVGTRRARRELRRHRRFRLVAACAGGALIVGGVLAGVLVMGHGSDPSNASPRGGDASSTSTSADTAPTTSAPSTSTSISTPATTTPTVATTTTVTAASSTAPVASTATTVPVAPATSAASLSAVAGKTILIDPGHNGQNYAHASVINRLVNIGTQMRACDTTGTATNDGYSETAYNLDVALKLRTILEGAGAHVVMTRTDNNGVGPCIDQRAKIGNDAHAAVGISIHADGGPPTGRGFHVIFPKSVVGLTAPIYANSKRLALDVRAAYAAGSGMPITTYLAGGGLSERSDLGGLNLSTIPKVFIETGNMRNATDAALLKSDAFRQRAAMAIANGLASYLAGR